MASLFYVLHTLLFHQMKPALYACTDQKILIRRTILFHGVVKHFQNQLTARLFFIHNEKELLVIYDSATLLCILIVFGKLFFILMDKFQGLTLHALVIIHVLFQNILYLIHVKPSYLLSALPVWHTGTYSTHLHQSYMAPL